VTLTYQSSTSATTANAPPPSNALKNPNSLVLSWLSVAAFVNAGAIAWRERLVMMVAATTSGFSGARWSKRLPVKWVRWSVIAVGLVMTTLFFARR
jgi:hypothetical protein